MPPPATGDGTLASVTLYTAANYIAGRADNANSNAVEMALRFADAATTSSEFDFVKPGSGGFGLTENKFMLDPCNSDNIGILSYYSGQAGAAKALIQVDSNPLENITLLPSNG
jgi:hypothetical protein